MGKNLITYKLTDYEEIVFVVFVFYSVSHHIVRYKETIVQRQLVLYACRYIGSKESWV